jgi:hypothetical protein
MITLDKSEYKLDFYILRLYDEELYKMLQEQIK